MNVWSRVSAENADSIDLAKTLPKLSDKEFVAYVRESEEKWDSLENIPYWKESVKREITMRILFKHAYIDG